MDWFESSRARIASLYIPVIFKSSGTINVGDRFYEETADFYAAFFASRKDDDIPMYRSIAQRTGSPVLDAACGDGRVSIPLAIDGHTVFGFDFSDSMLRLCRNRIRREEQSNIHLFRSSMQVFACKNVFRLALIPYNSFNHLLSEADQRLCLSGLWRALRKDGLLVMEILPYHEYYFTGIRVRKSGSMDDGKYKVTAYSQVIQDTSNKRHTVYWYITIKHPGEPPKRLISSYTRKDVPLKRAEQLLTDAGFALEEVRYAYSADDKTDDKRIIIARKP